MKRILVDDNSSGVYLSPMQNELNEFTKVTLARKNAISRNASLRMRGKSERVAVPAKPVWPLVPVAYEVDGSYIGRLAKAEDARPGWVVKMEKAIW